ncbi:MAG: FKBP-type peptidyl-prolyl cis-trans isomerase [Actinomycetota bacterium]
MRHVAALAASFLLLTAACSSAKSGGTGTTSTTSISNKPKVTLPNPLPTTLIVTDITKGTGPTAAKGDTVIVNYVGVRSADGKEFDNSYDHQPFEVPLGAGNVIPGWDQGLVGVQAGSRRQLDIPASLAYGNAPPDTTVIKPGDALSFVIDVLQVFPASKATDEPTVKVSTQSNITTAKHDDLVVGTGDPAGGDQHVAIRIVLYRADDATKITSTWGGPPLVFQLGTKSTTYPGFVTATTGMKIGGRRVAQIPFATVFDGKGNTNLKVPAAVDIIAVIDLIGSY